MVRGLPEAVYGASIIVPDPQIDPPTGTPGAMLAERTLCRIELPHELAGPWTVTLHAPTYVRYQFAVGSPIIDGPPNIGGTFARVRWGAGLAGINEVELDWRLGGAVTMCGRSWEVSVRPMDPQDTIAGLSQRVPYRLSASLTPGVSATSTRITRTIRLGNLVAGASSARAAVPRYAVEWQNTVALQTTSTNRSRIVRFYGNNGEEEVANFPYQGTSNRNVPMEGSWLPVPPMAQVATVENNSSVTLNNVLLHYRLAI